MTFQLDTSGVVRAQDSASFGGVALTWSDLSPFTQGYVEALLREIGAAFHMLAPETLARIIADCDERLSHYPAYREDSKNAELGALTWKRRQQGDLIDYRLPPLTVLLGGDGKVRFATGQPS